MSKDRHIVIHKVVGLTPNEFHQQPPDPNAKEAPFLFGKGQVLRVIPNPDKVGDIEPNTIPQFFADRWCGESNIASEYTADAIAKATAAIEKENKMVQRAHELIDGGD